MPFDFVIIGAGPAGEAAAYMARRRGASVAIVDRDLVGGSCPHWGCVPSKSLLHGAERHASGADYSWSRASDRRDWMINRVGVDYPDDSGHVRRLEEAGATVYRGEGRITGPGRVVVRHGGGRQTSGSAGSDESGSGAAGSPAGATEHALEATNILVAVGSETKIPPVEGIETIRTWTNKDATGARKLPESLLVLGGGPTGVELAQMYARFGVPVTIVQSGPRLIPTDHPRNSEAAAQLLRRDGVDLRLGVRALRAMPRETAGDPDVVVLDDGSEVTGHATLLAVGRVFPTAGLGLETVGLDPAGLPRDGRLRVADGVWLLGDVAGPELHTHQAHYQGEMAVRMALGDDVTPDYRALPRATYTDPELAFVGVSLEQAQADGRDAFECVADFPSSSKGYSVEAEFGHVTIVVDRSTHRLVGAAIAAPDGSAALHECVVAMRADVPIDVLADTIHAFPSTSRTFNGLFSEAAQQLGLIP